MAKPKPRNLNYVIPVSFNIQLKRKINPIRLVKYREAINYFFEEDFRKEAIKSNTRIELTITEGGRFFGEAFSDDPKLYQRLHDRLDNLLYILGML
jgi:hypothetical protein